MLKTIALSLLFVSIAPAAWTVGELVTCNGCLAYTCIACDNSVSSGAHMNIANHMQ